MVRWPALLGQSCHCTAESVRASCALKRHPARPPLSVLVPVGQSAWPEPDTMFVRANAHSCQVPLPTMAALDYRYSRSSLAGKWLRVRATAKALVWHRCCHCAPKCNFVVHAIFTRIRTRNETELLIRCLRIDFLVVPLRDPHLQLLQQQQHCGP